MPRMKLRRFRVTNFRSVEDSGWIETGDITAFIGTNESGKTNLLTPLWKLNPAQDGAIEPLADYPRKEYNALRNIPDKDKPVFIQAEFDLADDLAGEIAELTGANIDDVRVALVQRNFAGRYIVGFPKANPKRSVPRQEVDDLLRQAQADLQALPAAKAEEPFKEAIHGALEEGGAIAQADLNVCDVATLRKIKAVLNRVDQGTAAKRSTLAPRYGQLLDAIDALVTETSTPAPGENTQARQLVVDNLLSFVYYSNYGNLDSEIYLPHVIENMTRTDLGSREQAKARTLKVLFDFVKLSPKEILELGRSAETHQRPPTPEEIQAAAQRTKEREVLLQSASTDLTRKFRDWWRQGEYRLRFQADGNHFRIWVSDDRRPEEIELEGRSTGLQWFLSFFLVFLVESMESHKDTMLLLDEPGLSLHPLAQDDLSKFFENLAQTNQLIYTTHSPFMVSANHLDRVSAVYVDDRGTTRASSNLRAGEANPAQTRSIYPVHAALGLTVSEAFLQGCQPVIVEGASDQFYLSAIKTYLIAKGRATPKREVVFVPAGGAKGIATLAPILAAKEEELPPVLLDSDGPGQNWAKQLEKGLYAHATARLLMVGDIVEMGAAEVEDLFPTDFLAGVITKYLRGPDEDFDECVTAGEPIVPQVEAYAKQHGLPLSPGWKVEIAKLAKARLQRDKDPLAGDVATLARWEALFAKFER